jgi:hypothetical protein
VLLLYRVVSVLALPSYRGAPVYRGADIQPTIPSLSFLWPCPIRKVDWTKDFYSLMQSPSKEKLASTFDVLTYQYAKAWDEDVKKAR